MALVKKLLLLLFLITIVFQSSTEAADKKKHPACRTIKWQTYRRRIEALTVTAQELADSAFMKRIKSFFSSLDLMPSDSKGPRTTLSRLFGFRYLLDVFDLGISIKGLEDVVFYDFSVDRDDYITFNANARKVKGTVLLDAAYEARSFSIFNGSYCILAPDSKWNKPCPYKEIYLKSSFAATNVNFQVKVRVKLLTCNQGGFFSRVYCKGMSAISYVKNFLSILQGDFLSQMVRRIEKVEIKSFKLSYDTISYHTVAYHNKNKMRMGGIEFMSDLDRKTMDEYTYLLSVAVLEETVLDAGNQQLKSLIDANNKNKDCY